MVAPKEKVRALIALATNPAVTQEEARTAAIAAVKLIAERGFEDESDELRKLRDIAKIYEEQRDRERRLAAEDEILRARMKVLSTKFPTRDEIEAAKERLRSGRPSGLPLCVSIKLPF